MGVECPKSIGTRQRNAPAGQIIGQRGGAGSRNSAIERKCFTTAESASTVWTAAHYRPRQAAGFSSKGHGRGQFRAVEYHAAPIGGNDEEARRLFLAGGAADRKRDGVTPPFCSAVRARRASASSKF